jgi:UDP-N-acetylmuramoyl-tripeptide--D-alanyl-D-alanine ligase
MENLFHLFYECDCVCTDTRSIATDSLYIALKGANFNGNEFAQEAITKGAKYAIVDESRFVDNDRIFLVEDSLSFLQKLANYHRHKFNIPVIGITGSNGKTTSKELINAVLSQSYNTLCTKGNLNNHIGVPLTLLMLNKQHEMAIIEMGANKPGDIKELSEITEPNYGIITNIGKAHLEGFKTIEGVIKTKTELYDNLEKSHGKIIYNYDDEIIANQRFRNVDCFSYGKSQNAEVIGELIELNPFVKLKWQTENYISESIQTNLVGSYNFYNFLAAISFGLLFNVPKEKINKAIINYVPTNNRSQVLKTPKNTLIVDCYNANPSSMLSALESFVSNTQSNKIAIIGDMLELGDESKIEHAKILDFCLKNKLNFITIGPIFKEINPLGFSSVSDFENDIDLNPLINYSILLKGSRGIALEKLIPKL